MFLNQLKTSLFLSKNFPTFDQWESPRLASVSPLVTPWERPCLQDQEDVPHLLTPPVPNVGSAISTRSPYSCWRHRVFKNSIWTPDVATATTLAYLLRAKNVHFIKNEDRMNSQRYLCVSNLRSQSLYLIYLILHLQPFAFILITLVATPMT